MAGSASVPTPKKRVTPAQHPHPGPGLRHRAALLLAGERDGPETVGVAASGGALGVEADLAGGQDAALDGVDLANELAVAGQRDVFALEEVLEFGGPALLAAVGERLRHDLGIVVGQVLDEVHVDVAPVDGKTRHRQVLEQAPEVVLIPAH